MTRKLVVLIATLIVCSLATSAQAATPMLSVSDVVSGGHTCALTQSGKVYCWGDNSHGELGVTTGMSEANGVATPQLVPLPGPASQIATGGLHSCALLEGGAVYCWGSNYAGELGNTTNNATLNPNPTPSLVPTGAGVTSIAAGGYDTCFVYADGSARCIGDNSFGQLAFPVNITANPNPTLMQMGGSLVAKVVIGGNFSCVLLRTASVKCEGFNPDGQLANSTGLGSYSATPVPAGLSGPVTDIDAGSSHACAILQDATTWCWGTNAIGQLGIGSADGSSHYTPTKVAIGPAQQLALGATHTCVRLGSIGTDCFGNNLAGELGVSDNVLTFNPNPTPLLSAFDGNALFLAAGGGTTCELLGDGSVRCAGDNGDSNLGVAWATMNHSYIPVAVAGLNVFDIPPKLALKASKPKLKYKKSGRKIVASGRVKVTAAGAAVTAAGCTGRASARLERKSGKRYKKVVSGSPKLNVKKGACGFDVKLKLANNYAGRKLSLHLGYAGGANTIGFDTRFSAKVKRLKF